MNDIRQPEIYNNGRHPQQAEEEINYKRIAILLFSRWPHFAASLFVCLLLVFLFNRYVRQQEYTVDTGVIISENLRNPNLMNVFQNTVFQGGSNYVAMGNETELLRSYTLSRRALDKLNWRTSWYEKDIMRWKDMYLSEPFIVNEVGGTNVENVYLHIEPDGEGGYSVRANGTGLSGGQEIDVKFRGNGRFGEPFINEYFRFTLYPKYEEATSENVSYRFRFNNTNSLARNFLERLKIAAGDRNSEVISISIDSRTPMREIHYLNGLVGEYMDRKIEIYTETDKRSLEFINNQLAGMSDSLNAAGNVVTRFRSQNQLLDISMEGGMVMTRLGEIEKEKMQARMQLDYFHNLLRYMENAEGMKQIVTPSVVGIQDQSLNAIVLKLSDLYSRYAVLSFSAYEDSPTLVQLNNEITQVRGQLRENLINLSDNVQLNIKNLEAREDEINRQLNNLPLKEQQFINIQRRYELTSDIYTFMLQRRAEIDISLASAVSNVQVIDPAHIDRVVKSGTSPKLWYLLALMLGLAIPAGIIIAVDMFSSTIHLQEDIEKLTPLSIIGNIPHAQGTTELAVAANPSTPLAEAYRSVRTNMQYLFSNGQARIIGIHSLCPGEGKSFSAVNLATILALNDNKVLLIGADLRRPRLHKIFNVINKSGMSTYLAGSDEYEDVIRTTGITNLWLAPSGPIPPNPSELLGRSRYAVFLERAKQDFDYIIVDNAPVPSVTDGLITGRHASLNIFVLRHGVSRRNHVKLINHIVEQGQMPNAKIIVNAIKTRRYNGLSYYSYYHYKYSYV